MKAAGVLTVSLLALLGGALTVGPAVAAPPPAKRPQDELAAKSAITGTAFPDKPFVLQDNGTYRDFMGMVARELNRKCKSLEHFGWDIKLGDQNRLNQIVDVTMDAIQKDGFKATQLAPKSTEGSLAVTISAEKAKKQALIMWAPVGKGVVLLICDAIPGK